MNCYNSQVPNGHEEDELADGEVMNYMCRQEVCLKIDPTISNTRKN